MKETIEAIEFIAANEALSRFIAEHFECAPAAWDANNMTHQDRGMQPDGLNGVRTLCPGCGGGVDWSFDPLEEDEYFDDATPDA